MIQHWIAGLRLRSQYSILCLRAVYFTLQKWKAKQFSPSIKRACRRSPQITCSQPMQAVNVCKAALVKQSHALASIILHASPSRDKSDYLQLHRCLSDHGLRAQVQYCSFE